jgi:hypothetical protein
MKRQLFAGAACTAGLAMAAAPAAAVQDSRGTQTKDCGAGNRIVYDGPSTMWPPNHAYRPLTVTAKAAFGFMPVGLHSAGVSDEAETGNGSGNTTDDVAPASDHDFGWGAAVTGHQLRAERAGKGDGRVYTITATASFPTGPCSATFTAKVPHDRGKPKKTRRR